MSEKDDDDKVFKALASPLRRAIMDALRDGPATTGALCTRFADLDRCTVMQHLKVLERAELVMAQRKGRERWNSLNALPIKRIQDRWIAPHAAHALSVLGRIADDLDPDGDIATDDGLGDMRSDAEYAPSD